MPNIKCTVCLQEHEEGLRHDKDGNLEPSPRYVMRLAAGTGDFFVADDQERIWIAKCHSSKDARRIARLLNADS